MGEFGRIITNLGLAYGLMNKDQFIDAVARYAQEKDMSEDKMMGLVENIFEELEITHRRRQASQMYEAYEMKKRSENPETADFFEDLKNEATGASSSSAEGNREVLSEIKALRKSIEQLTEALSNKEKGE